MFNNRLEMVMTNPLADALQGLLEQVQTLHMAHTVQRSAYVALALRLQRQALLDVQGLAADLELLGSTQSEPGWQSGLAELAAVLQHVGDRP
jgi:hypothetical protein